VLLSLRERIEERSAVLAAERQPPGRNALDTGVLSSPSPQPPKDDVMTMLRMLAFTALATTTIGVGGLAAAPTRQRSR
jgi:hypothetical protein